MTTRVLQLTILALATALGCRDRRPTIHRDDAASPATVKPVDVCVALERAKILYRDRCEHELLWSGPIETAVANARHTCELLVEAPGIAFDPAVAGQCATRLEKAPCYAPLPNECVVSGTLADGAACAFDEQCRRHSHCLIGEGMCGVCTPSRKHGESCDSRGDCDEELFCRLGYPSRCEPIGGLGAPCKWRGLVGCAAGLYCGLDREGDPWTCRPLVGEGAACRWTMRTALGELLPDVLCAREFECEGGVCVRQPVRSTGEVCRRQRDCRNDATCRGGRCTPYGGVGAACGDGEVSCRFELRCINSACVQRDARACN